MRTNFYNKYSIPEIFCFSFTDSVILLRNPDSNSETRQSPDKSHSVNAIYEHDRQCKYNVTLRHLCVTMVTKE
jgi:hypothetical protein